jgi:sulfoxide reductase heme-binding subunit YedZ
MNRFLASKWTKLALFLLSLVPFGILLWLVWQAYSTGNPTEYVSANPIEYITHDTGTWTLRFVLLTLTITPARRIFKQPNLIAFRRMLGL